MIPYLLAVVGGYLVAQSRKSETFADGGNVKTRFKIGDRVSVLATVFYVGPVIFFKDEKGNIFLIYDKEFNLKEGETYKITGTVSRENSVENTYLVYTDYNYKAGEKVFLLNRVKIDAKPPDWMYMKDGGIATEPMVVTFGKHSGKTIDEIFETDRGWVKWFVEKYKTEPFIDFKGNSRMPKLTEQDIAMKEQARELLAKNPEKTRDKSVSSYIGRIGDRVTILATVVHIGPSTIFFKDERGNVFYIYDKSFDVSGKEGEMFKVTGTVTKQWDKAGEKVTYLNRAKVEKYKKPADWMYMKDGGSVGDPRFTFKTFDEYDYAKRGGYFDFNTVEVDAVDEKGMERFFQPKSEEEYLKIVTDGRYKIIQETPVELYFDIQEYYDPEDPEEREYEYEYEYKKGGKVGVTRASSLKKLRDAS